MIEAVVKRRRQVRCGLFLLGLAAFGVAVLGGCEDDPLATPPVTSFDGSVQLPDGNAPADVQVQAPVDAGQLDATAEASASPLAPFLGIWRGVGHQGAGTWTILADIHGGPSGGVVGVMTYPSLACGGTLVLSGPLDGGVVDAGDAGNAGDAGASLTLHESVSSRCIQEGEDTFTLMPSGDLAYEYRTSPTASILATGTLTRVGTPGASASSFTGVWRNGELNGANLRPLLVSVSRDDTVGAASGVFLVADPNGVDGCGGHWVLASRSGALELTEVFNDAQIRCRGPGQAFLRAAAGGGLQYDRVVDGGGLGTDAGGGDGGLHLTRF